MITKATIPRWPLSSFKIRTSGQRPEQEYHEKFVIHEILIVSTRILENIQYKGNNKHDLFLMYHSIDIIQHSIVKTNITLFIVMAILHKWVIIRYSCGMSGIPISRLINPPGEKPKLTPKVT